MQHLFPQFPKAPVHSWKVLWMSRHSCKVLLRCIELNHAPPLRAPVNSIFEFNLAAVLPVRFTPNALAPVGHASGGAQPPQTRLRRGLPGI